MPETICPFCKKNWPQDFRWCMEDGSELEDDKGQYVEDQSGIPGVECPECGAKVDPRDEFCAGCGTRLQSAEAARALHNELSCSKCGALVNPNDEFCGGCGAAIKATAEEEGASQQLPEAAAGGCPNCGMEITPGEAFCGTCGHRAQAAAPQAQSGFTASAAPASCPGCGAGITPGEMFCGSCGFNVSASAAPAPAQPSAAAGCPNCGMEVSPGEAFCGTCGHNMQSAAQAPAQPAPVASGAACPNCGEGATPGEMFCGSCGFNMAQASAPAAPAYQPQPAAAPSGQGCPSCGMAVDPGETFCGTCGFNLQASAAPAQQSYETPALPSAAAGCPNCGMEVSPGETFCGSCGHNMQSAAQAPAQPAPAAPGAACPNCGAGATPGEMFCGSCGFNMAQASAPAAPAYQPPPAAAPSGSGCPSCGMAVDPGETFCGTCGFNLQAAPSPAPAEPEPIYASSEASSPSLSCPNCGMEIAPGEPFCGTCGHNLAGSPDQDDSSMYAAPAPATAGPAPATAAGEACPSCGMEINSGEPFCGTCGFNLSSTPEPSVQQSYDAPAMPPGAGCPNCGMENDPGETYCGTCGFEIQGGSAPAAFSRKQEAPQAPSEPDLEYSPFAAAPAPNTAVDPAHGAQCPICGANVYDGEDACGNCGYAMGDQSAYDLSQPTPPQAAPAGPYDGFIPLKKKSYFTCAKCGSSNTAPGGMYCADCGAMVGEGLDDDEFSGADAPPEEPVDQPPLRSLSDFLEEELVCPECNIVAAPGSDTCLVCGMKVGVAEEKIIDPFAEAPKPAAGPYLSDEEMIPQPPPPTRAKPSAPLADFTSDEPVWSAPVSDQFAATSASDFQPVGDDFVAASQEPAWDEAPAWGDAPPAAAGDPVCVECGATASSGDALCPACGGLLIMPETPASSQPFFIPEPEPAAETPKPAAVAFPPMPEDAPAAAPDIAGGKVCTCCGVSNQPDAEYCSSCGVDFD